MCAGVFLAVAFKFCLGDGLGGRFCPGCKLFAAVPLKFILVVFKQLGTKQSLVIWGLQGLSSVCSVLVLSEMKHFLIVPVLISRLGTSRGNVGGAVVNGTSKPSQVALVHYCRRSLG
uniref:Putative secreted protein n=1 Tax=Ixodes ricinus TaxID=34613 RepID=A0A6B0ULH3_IXORI